MIKNFTKLMLTAILLVAGMGGVKATKKYASFSVATGCSWTSETNTMGFTEVNGWQILVTALPSGNISSYTKFHATLSDMTDNINNIRLRIKDTSDHYADYNLVSGENNVDLAALATANPSCDFTSIADITLWSPTSAAEEKTVGTGDDAASVVITDCYMEKPFVFAFDATGTAIVDVTDLKAWGCISLDPQTGIVTNSYDADNNNGYLKIDFSPAVDMSSVYGFKVNYSGDNILDGISVNAWKYKFGSNIYGRKDIAASMAEETSIAAWIWGARATTGSMTITSVEFYSSVISANPGEESLMSGLTSYHKDGSEWKTTGYTPNYRVNEATGAAYFGVDWSGENCQNYTDVEGYKAIRVYSDGSNTPRAMFFNSDANGQQSFNFTWNAKGYYELLLSDVYTSVSNYKLISIRPASGTTSSISGIYMVVNDPIYDYVISGNGVRTAGVTATLADAAATSIDATGLTNTSAIELTSANPNCLFIANSGKLSNDNNVIVSDACAQLALTDGNPFKAPSAFTATAAPTYNRAFTASTMTTVCLPFALTETEAATLGTFYGLSTFDGVDLHFTSVAAPLANTPYLVIPANTGITLSEKGKSIAATPASLDESIDDVKFIGTLAATAIPASDETNSYFAFNNGELVKITSQAATLPAFRGYFKVTTSAINGNNARRLGVSFGNDATGISDATRLKDKGQMKNDIFDLQGRRVKTFKKGLYIVNGKKVIK